MKYVEYMKKHLDSMIFFVIFSTVLISYLPLFISFSLVDSRLYLSFLSDDFFYYLQISKNICLLGQSTFDTLTLTNGYHPLWMIVLTGLTCLTDHNEFLIVTIILTIKVLASMVSFFFFYKIAWHFSHDKLKSYLVVLVPFFIFLRLTYDMEVLLTVPLLAYFVFFLLSNTKILNASKWVMIKLGFIASLLVLSRLDTAIFVLLFFGYLVSVHWYKKDEILRFILYFSIGGFLVPIYLFSNLIFFETLLPLSGMAKQLKMAFSFTPSALTDILSFKFQKIETFAFVLTMISPFLLLSSQIRKDKDNLLLLIIAIFPLVYYMILAFVSDWPIWRWYLYPLPIALLTVSIMILKVFQIKEIISKSLVLILVLFVSLYAVKPYYYSNTPVDGIYKTALVVAEFAQEHPGTYAMGDRAGKVGYLIGHPLVQLEGLVADKKMLMFIKNETDLIDVLRSYGVDYYIATTPVKKGGCYSYIEPIQAGKTSYTMSGKLCYEPIIVYEEIGTYIFKINKTNEKK